MREQFAITSKYDNKGIKEFEARIKALHNEMDKNFKKRQVEKFNKNKAEVHKLEDELEALKFGSLKDEIFTDQKDKEHILSKDAQKLWLKTFKLDSLEKAFIPFHNERIRKALGGGKEIRLQIRKLIKASFTR